MARTLNLGIVAHVDAGKTSLTERLLYDAGAITTIGRVDDGSTQTDSLALERRRGITIRSAVAAFSLGDLAVNLLDTPGHPDFIGEVDRVLSLLDGAVLVLSAVEGVQPQTRVLLRALHRLRVPTLLLVNKIDRAGADPSAVLAAVAARLSPSVVAMGAVSGPGTAAARFHAYDPLPAGALDVLSAADDGLLRDYVTDESAGTAARLRASLVVQTARARVHPVFFGSAITGAGMADLARGIATLLPSAGADASAPVSGTVFKVERDEHGARIAYVRLWAGTLRARDVVPVAGTQADVTQAKITGVDVIGSRDGAAGPGQIARVRGLRTARIGDVIGVPPAGRGIVQHFAPPTLETVVVAAAQTDRARVRAALAELAEQDPLINLRTDAAGNDPVVSLYGEVQKEVIEATLAADYGVAVRFRASSVVCVERPVTTGAHHEMLGADGNPHLATVGLRIEPGPAGSGVEFGLEVEAGSLPAAFFVAAETSVRATLRTGRYGWEVTDCRVTMTHSGYWARQSTAHGGFDKSMSSTAADFRDLTRSVLRRALDRAGTQVLEPVDRFRLEAPTGVLGAVLAMLSDIEAVPRTSVTGEVWSVIEGDVPARLVPELQRLLPPLTNGDGVLEHGLLRYAAVTGAPPRREW